MCNLYKIDQNHQLYDQDLVEHHHYLFDGEMVMRKFHFFCLMFDDHHHQRNLLRTTKEKRNLIKISYFKEVIIDLFIGVYFLG